MPKAVAAVPLICMGLYALLARKRLAHAMAEGAAAWYPRHKERIYRQQHRALLVVLPVTGALFVVVGVVVAAQGLL